VCESFFLPGPGAAGGVLLFGAGALFALSLSILLSSCSFILRCKLYFQTKKEEEEEEEER